MKIGSKRKGQKERRDDARKTGGDGRASLAGELFWINHQTRQEHEQDHTQLPECIKKLYARGWKQVMRGLRPDPTQQRRAKQYPGKHLAINARLSDLQK